MADNYINVQKV